MAEMIGAAGTGNIKQSRRVKCLSKHKASKRKSKPRKSKRSKR